MSTGLAVVVNLTRYAATDRLTQFGADPLGCINKNPCALGSRPPHRVGTACALEPLARGRGLAASGLDSLLLTKALLIVAGGWLAFPHGDLGARSPPLLRAPRRGGLGHRGGTRV